MAEEDGFQYIPGRSTSNIFYYHPIINPQHLLVLLWRPMPTFLHENDLDLALQTTVCSSCCGLIAARNIITGVYYVGNPYQPDIADHIPLRYAYLTNPTPYSFNVTHAVLAVVPPSLFLLISATQDVENVFGFYTFVSSDFRWHSFEAMLEGNHGRIVRDSGVSVGRTAYWLLGEPGQVPTSLLSFLIEDKVVVIYLPSRYLLGIQARMQLGRALGRLGLVVVNETDSKVELFILQDDNPEDPLQRVRRFSVEVDDAAEDVAMWREEDLTMVCREMPRPIRFDSFKVELLFWVQGRVVLLEEDSDRPDLAHEYRLRVLPDEDPVSVLPDEVTELITSNGVPHVHSDLLATDFFVELEEFLA